MKDRWNFATIVRAGFIVTILGALTIAVFSFYSIRAAISSKDIVVYEHAQSLIDVERLRVLSERVIASGRGFLITKDPAFLQKMRASHGEFRNALQKLYEQETSSHGDHLLDLVDKADQQYFTTIGNAIRKRKQDGNLAKIQRIFEEKIQPKRVTLEDTLFQFVNFKRKMLEAGKHLSKEETQKRVHILIAISVTAILLSLVIAILLGRTLTRLYRIAQQAIKKRDDFVAIVSHDLKNPLSSIFMNASLIKKVVSEHSDISKQLIERCAATIENAANRMNKLIEDILDVNRIESGKLSFDPSVCNFSNLIEENIRIFEPIAEGKKIKLSVDIENDLPSICCDRQRVSQILSNLVGNALKFTPAGGLISITTRATLNELLVTVTDTGMGISRENLTHIFDRGWQMKETSQMGIGLGLSITKGIVETHGGRIWAESTVGKGSSFFFSLPLS